MRESDPKRTRTSSDDGMMVPLVNVMIVLYFVTFRLYDDYVHSSYNDPETAKIDVRKFHEFVERSINKMSDCLQNNTFKKCVYFGKPYATTYTAAGLVS